MKKSIFLFFAAILCAMTANAQLYLRGGFNNWNDLTADYQFVSNVCELELPGLTTYEFKIADSGWSKNFGGNHTFTATATKTLSSGGGNMKITTTIPGTYKFEFVESTKKLTVTYPELPAPHDITVRAKVPAHWTNDIYAHVWTSENASGSDVGPLTKEGDYYVVTKNAGALYVIFKNGSAWSDKNQTVDLCYTEDVCLQLNQSGSAKGTATVIDCGAVAKDITVKAVVPGAWEDKITAWVWPTGGEGKEVTPTKEGNWYVITENCIELNVIFKNGEGWKGNEHQTANITGVSENTCYQISALNKDGEGKCTYTVVDCEAAIEPEAKPVDVYTIVGAETLVGTAWDLNNTDNDMTKQDDGSYVLVKENVELATTGTYEYKVVKNRSWDWKGVNEGNNLTLTGVDVDGTYNVTFTLNKELNALTTSLELVEAKKVIPECYVAGDESLTGQNWNAKSVLMTYDEASEVYTATLTAVPAGTHNMKVVYGGEWLGFDHLATPAPANVKEGDDKKIQFTLAEAGDVTVTYHATNGIGLIGNFAVPETKYYIAGTENLTGFDWKENGLEMTKEGDVYKHTFSEKAAGTYEFKITNGTWTDPWGFSNLAANYVGVTQGKDGEGNPNGNIKIVTEEAKNIIVIFDPANNKITLEDWEVAAPATVTYVLMGVEGDWTTGIEMDVNPDNDKEYMLTCQAISATDAVKVVKLEDGEQVAWYGSVKDDVEVTVTYDDRGNIQLSEGYYNFYFDSSLEDKQLWIAAATDCAPEITEEYDITITNLETEVPQPGFLALLGSESEVLGLSVQLFLNEYTGENGEYQLNEVSYLASDNVGELTFVSGSMTQEDYGTDAKIYTGTVIVELQGQYFQFNMTMYKKQLPTKTLTITGADLVVDLWNNITITAVHNSASVFVQFSDFEYVASKAYTYLMLEVGEWVDDDDDGVCDNVDYISELIEEATVTISGSTFTLKSKFEGTDANYDLTITGTLPLIIGEGDNSSVLAQNGQTADAYISRTFESGNLYTVSFPFALSQQAVKDIFGSRVELYEYTSLAEDNGELVLNFSKLATPAIVAGKPYLMKPNKESYGFGLKDVTISSTTVPVSFTTAGTTITMQSVLTASGKTNGTSQYWLAEDNNLYNKSVNLKGLRAIFNVQTNKSNVRARAAFNENVETGVEDIIATDAPVKVIVNGQLIIIRDGEMYNVQGQLVK